MRDLLDHPWAKVLLIATTVAMCSFALRETASVTTPVVMAVYDVLVPVAIAFVIAYVLTPIIDLISLRVGLGRTIATGALFLVTTLAVVGAGLLILPAVIREGVELADQAARGETFTDADGDGVRAVAEPFVDRNHNGRYDPALISQLGAWIEDRQRGLRQLANLDVDAAGLALLLDYEGEIAPLRDRLNLALAGEGRTGDGPPAWDPRWPGASAMQVAEAERLHPAHSGAIRAAGAAYYEAHTRWLAVARALRLPPAKETPATHAQRLRQAGTALTPETRARANAILARLEADELNSTNPVPIHALLVELRGGEPGAGAKALGAGIAQIEQAIQQTFDTAPERLGSWAKATLSNVNGLLGLMLDALLVPIYAFFLVLAMPAIRSTAKEFLPAKHRGSTLRIIREIERAVSAFFRGRLIICSICALVGIIGFLVIGLFGTHVPYGVLWGFLIGMVTVMPLAGLLFLVPALALTMIQPAVGPMDIVLVISVYVVIQGVEMVLIPVILGREVEIHAVTLIIALLLCGKLLGVLGLILAVPIAATARILNREYLWPRLKALAAKGVEAVQPPPEPDSSASSRRPVGDG